MSTTAERFLEETRPRAIVVGNPGFERYLLHRARSVGIPTILIQHGILGDYCQLLDPPVDHYLVRGSFWKEFLSPEARQRAQVLNPHRNRPGASAAGSRDRRLVFLTAPSRADSPWDEGEVDEILRVLLSAVGDCGGRLVVRVHPQEQLGTYRARVSRLRLGGEPPGDLVTFSQGGAIDEVLSGAAAAITYSSTAFLDCVQMKVPIISFGWHDFAYRRLIERHGVFTFCAGLAELGSVARRALREGIEPYSGEADFLDERTPDENLRRVLAKILGPPNGPAHLH